MLYLYHILYFYNYFFLQYISLATQIFQFMNKHFLNSKSNYVWRYVQSGLSEQHMVMLAAIIRDLDRESARTETGQLLILQRISLLSDELLG